MQSKFGEFIAEKRKGKCILLRSMAEKLGITVPYYSDIEKGIRNPPDMNLLGKITHILCLTEEDKDIIFNS